MEISENNISNSGPILPSSFRRTEIQVTQWMARNGLNLLRLSLGVIFLWFGVLKFFPGASPVEDLALRTMERMTFGIIPAKALILTLAVWESLIGMGLIMSVFMRHALILRVTLLLFFAQMLGTLIPFFLFTEELFLTFPFGLNSEGQYILKNLVLISAGLVIGATSRGGAIVSDPMAAGQAVEAEKKETEGGQPTYLNQKYYSRGKGPFCLPSIPQLIKYRIAS